MEQCELRGLTAKTLFGYRYNISKFLRFVKVERLEDLSVDLVKCYQKDLLQQNLSRYSVCNYLRSVKLFLRYLDKNYSTSISHAVVYPKRPKLMKQIYTTAEIKKMMQYISSCYMSLRNCIIFLLMYDCGLRLAEVVKLRTDCVDLDRRRIKVMGKGSKERFVPAGKLLCNYMQEYESGSVYFLCKKDGSPITEETIRNFFRRMNNSTGISVSPHKLRHNFATNFLLHQIEQGSVDLYQLQSIMGHSDAETTKIYLHFAQEILALSNSYSHIDDMFNSI